MLSLETSPLSQWSPERDTVVTLWVRQLVSLLVAQPVEGGETWVEGRGESPLRSEQCNGASTRRSAVSTASRSIVVASRSRILVRRVGVDGVRALYDEVAFASCERSVHSAPSIPSLLRLHPPLPPSTRWQRAASSSPQTDTSTALPRVVPSSRVAYHIGSRRHRRGVSE